MITVKDLMDLEIFRSFELVAGECGVRRVVSWPNIAQTVSIREWLVGGDVIIMTGIGLSVSPALLNSYLDQAVQANAACLIILLNEQLISCIPQSTIDYANLVRFPIFAAPWQTKLSHLIRDVSGVVMRNKYNEILLESHLCKVLRVPPHGKMPDVPVLLTPDATVRSFYLIVFCLFPGALDQADTFEASPFAEYLRAQAQTIFHLSLLASEGNRLVLMVDAGRSPQEMEDFLKPILTRLPGFFPGKQIHYQISEAFSALEDLPLHVATACEQAQHKILRQTMTADDADFLSLITHLTDQKLLEAHAARAFEPLRRHDAQHNQELMHTLAVFLSTHGNYSRAADILHTHRNSLKNRIERIEQMLKISLEDPDTRNNLYLFCRILRLV